MLHNNTQQQAEQKLIILYTIEEFGIPLTNNQITQFIMEHDYMNYFALQQCLVELVSSGMLEYSESEKRFFYLTTEKGKNTLNYFKNRISSDLIAKLKKSIDLKKQILLKEMQILADYTKKQENEYIVNLKVIENDATLIHLTLNVVSNKQAKQICDKWKREASSLYGEIINLLIQ